MNRIIPNLLHHDRFFNLCLTLFTGLLLVRLILYMVFSSNLIKCPVDHISQLSYISCGSSLCLNHYILRLVSLVLMSIAWNRIKTNFSRMCPVSQINTIIVRLSNYNSLILNSILFDS